MTEPLTTAERRALVAQLTELKQTLKASLEDRGEAAPVDLDGSFGRLSRMDALQHQQMAIAARRRVMVRLDQIDEAFKRLRDDSYGECAACGDDIGIRRLRVRPEVLLCVGCQTEAGG